MQYCYVFNCAKKMDKHRGGTSDSVRYKEDDKWRVARLGDDMMARRIKKLTELPINHFSALILEVYYLCDGRGESCGRCNSTHWTVFASPPSKNLKET